MKYLVKGEYLQMLNIDTLHNPYPSRRMTVYAKNGMVATSQPLAAEAGLAVLRKGGNAIDAAIAAAVCLTVVEPTSNGIGGDAFALVWSKGQLYGLNASGPAPQLLTLQALEKAGYQEMPAYGWFPVTVPGAPAAWAELSSRFGKLPLTETMAPAITYAQQGFPISPTVGRNWEIAFQRYAQDLKEEQYQNWFKTFAPQGRTPKIGEIWSSADHARTLQSIAETQAHSFYCGAIADQIDHFSQRYGGFLRKEDLAAYKPEWVTPISINYRGYEVWEIPPNGHGLVALLALNILKGFDFGIKESADSYHRQIEALKLAFADGKKYIADPSRMTLRIEDLLSDGYAMERRKLIGEKALQPEPGNPHKGGTVYLAAADSEGNMVSFIQSNYLDFGSGLVVPGTGICLHNRGNNFSLDPSHANCLEPGKKPYHTIIPGFLTKGHLPIGPFGVMGAFMQPQGHVQVIMNTLDYHLNPQASLDAPRWQWINGKTVEIEHAFSNQVAEELIRRGHDIRWSVNTAGFGRGQIIWRNKEGILVGGTEPRADGHIAMW
ncbi:gamma-glutamyltransferase family protein [Desulfosporosinus youngiae]|nr:gamma-glutamyltransferase family protein [Desulfosporosinus youngiae]